MSSKGYSALPTEEPRDSVDMESRPPPTEPATHEDLDDEEDEREPSANDRLLPFGPHRDDNSPPWYRTTAERATRWMRSRPGRIMASYRAFKKQVSARSVILAAIIGLLLASTIGLAISTGILAKRPERHYSCYGYTQTRIPWNWETYGHSSNYRLRFPSLFPPLSRETEPSCRSAWASLDDIDCHEKTLNRAWDNGKQLSMFEPRYDLYAVAMSDSSCIKDLELAHQLLSSQCTSKDVFDTSGYIGPFTADPELEAGPVAAVQTILSRVRHTARESPKSKNDYYRRYNSLPCVAELYQDWFIIDGMNAGNLHGLDVFLKGTNERSEPDNAYWRMRGFPNDQCDAAYAPDRYYSEAGAKLGPNDGDTQCSWCLINWFDRKLGSWEEGKVLDPSNGTVVDLSTYLRTIESAGRRCQAHDWDRIFRKNIWEYQSRGELPDDWEPEKGKSRASRPYSVYDVEEHRSSRAGRTDHSRSSWPAYEDVEYDVEEFDVEEYDVEEYDVEDDVEGDMVAGLRTQALEI